MKLTSYKKTLRSTMTAYWSADKTPTNLFQVWLRKELSKHNKPRYKRTGNK
jgi:hypothetical protein